MHPTAGQPPAARDARPAEDPALRAPVGSDSRVGIVDQRARFDPQELQEVLECYDVGAIEHSQEFPRGSYESAKVMIRTARGKYLLKRRPKGKDELQAVAFAHELQNWLVERFFPMPHLIGTRDNHSILRRGGSIYEMFEFFPGERYEPQPAPTRDAGRMLAVFHRLTADMPLRFVPPTQHYHDAPRTRAWLGRIGGQLARSSGAPSAAGRQDAVDELIAWLIDAYNRAAAAVEELGLGEWPEQIVHCDWHPGNLLFDHHRVVAVLDFDSARLKPAVTDMANGILQFSIQTGGRDVTTWLDACDEPRFAAFLEGYEELRRVSVDELRALPRLMIEALITESVGPIAAAGHFAQLDGFAFLQTVRRKVQWLLDHGERVLAPWIGQSAGGAAR